MPCHAMHPMQDLSLESFSYELQFDMHFYMHSYLHKIFILVKSGCYMLISPKGDRLLYIIWLHFYATNNMTEYEALVNGLCITTELRK
jgi:hypothetical protein